MEAVGLAASVITLISAAALTSSTLMRLRGLKGCPLYVLSALNEFNDFTATLILVQSVLGVEEITEKVLAELERLMGRAKYQLERLDTYLKQQVLREEPVGTNLNLAKLRRHARWKEVIGEAQHQMEGLQEALRSIKDDLLPVMSAGQL